MQPSSSVPALAPEGLRLLGADPHLVPQAKVFLFLGVLWLLRPGAKQAWEAASKTTEVATQAGTVQHWEDRSAKVPVEKVHPQPASTCRAPLGWRGSAVSLR